MKKERYKPVPFDLERTWRRWSRDPAFRAAHAALEDEFAMLDELLRARFRAGLTQADVAARMGIAQASVARLEASAGSRKHAPSVATLRRYADAVDCELRLSLVPKATRRAQPAAKPVRKTPRKRA
ncbi:MAG TPA: helix-turn-helix transcriptional regulator [Rhodanobacteraceae bacterium]|nr:helix-turn-helix transcriptional regulator [Rhodanobacteraceae bacterium]